MFTSNAYEYKILMGTSQIVSVIHLCDCDITPECLLSKLLFYDFCSSVTSIIIMYWLINKPLFPRTNIGLADLAELLDIPKEINFKHQVLFKTFKDVFAELKM